MFSDNRVSVSPRRTAVPAAKHRSDADPLACATGASRAAQEHSSQWVASLSSPNEFPAHIKCVEHPSDLLGLSDPETNMVLWRRELPRELDLMWEWLRTMPAALAGDWIAPEPQALRADLQKWVRDSAFSFAIEWLAQDIYMLSALFSAYANVLHPRVRLERVEDGACVLFHEDHLVARIICTYSGPGMQWVANEDADRTQLGLRGRTVAEANRAIVRDPSRIRTVPSGWVAFFKGALHENNRAGALIHRSAPVEGPRDFRIRLCIDDTGTCEG